MDVYQVKEQTKDKEPLTINYTRPRMLHRILANLIDIFIMALLFLALFIGVRAIVQNTPSYKTQMNQMRSIQVECGLYVERPGSETGELLDVVYYANNYKPNYGREFDAKWNDEGDPLGKNGTVAKAIDKFLYYCSNPDNCPVERYQELVKYYEEARLNPVLDGVHYFEKDGEEIKATALADNTNNLASYYNKVYRPFVEKKCIPFLTANVTAYHNIVINDYKLLLLLELPVAFLVAGFLTYFVPPLFFRRGRKTLGNALYHIGLIDERLLSPTMGKFTLRFLIFYFLELILSLFTIGIPYIISFSMMVFSKNKQSFPDYMMKLYVVDTSKANIYMDYVEAQLKNELHGEAVDFQMERPL